MKKLNELYPGSPEIPIKRISMNSKEVEPGDLFVCTKGVTADRHDFVEQAIEHGAVAIVASRKLNVSVPVIYVEDTNQELGKLMAHFCDHPEQSLLLIGITGTNGKTTVAQLIQDLLGRNDCGYIGTNGLIYGEHEEAIRNTTPDVDRMFPYLKQIKDAGCTYASIETSSEAFYRHRLDLFSFTRSILTNITEDHLNIHKTLDNYIACKCQLFEQTKKDGIAILNLDDPHYEMVRSCCHSQVLTYGTSPAATFSFDQIKNDFDHTTFHVHYQGKDYVLTSPLVGTFNVYNLAAALLTLLSFNMSMEEVISRIPHIHPPKGRLEIITAPAGYHIILDYAHTVDALQKLYDFVISIPHHRIITVTGSAGGREKEKRPQMGRLVLDHSDHVIFTMDDPREEDVNQIIDDLVSASTKTNFERIIDRPEAIQKAISMATKDDIVMIVGKGRDPYMAIGKEYLPYSDDEEIKKALAKY